MRTLCKITLLALVTLFILPADALAAARGGRRRGNSKPRSEKPPEDDKEKWGMHWYDSIKEAATAAARNKAPVFVAITRADNDTDDKMLDRLSSWPQCIELSKKDMAAVEVNATDPEGQEFIKKLGLKNMPAGVWLDSYGNTVSGQALPESGDAVHNIVSNWKNTLGNIEKYFKDHLSRGERLLGHGKLREAYLEYAAVAPLKGPDAEKGREGLQKVKDQWTKILAVAEDMAKDSHGRKAIVKGLRRDTVGLDFASVIEQEIQKVLTGVMADARPPEGRGDTKVAAKDPPAKTGSAMPAVENKPLSQLIVGSAPANATPERETEDAAVDTRGIAAREDERFKKADKLIQDATTSYRKACSDSMDRGAERNELLTSAHINFEMALSLIEQVTAGKPDGQIEKLMERISMMMYGCLKYQSL